MPWCMTLEAMLGAALVVGFRATINSGVTAAKPRMQIGKHSKA